MESFGNAYWVSPNRGLVLLRENWTQQQLPPLRLTTDEACINNLRHAPDLLFAELTAHYVDEDVVFACFPEAHPHLKFAECGVRVAGTFNDWGKQRDDFWKLSPEIIDGREVWTVKVPRDRVFGNGDQPEFKFVTDHWHWLNPDYHAPNLRLHHGGICNYGLDAARTGDHCLLFDFEGPMGLAGSYWLEWSGKDDYPAIPIKTGLFFYRLESEHPMGARIEGRRTVFRAFAPRASLAWVAYCDRPDMAGAKLATMERLDDGMTWEVVISKKLHDWYYYLYTDGHDIDGDTHFNPDMPLLDPWAKATVGHAGPGIIVDDAKLPKVTKPFTPPRWNDLVICEAHVRDLVKHAEGPLDDDDRLGFTGVTKWLNTKACYLRELGVNAVELQPVQQNDAPRKRDYHWGYMTTNYFAPNSHYSREPLKASAIAEFKEMVEAFHKHDLAVILDVVYNHVGEPNFLLYLDKQYYFHITPEGQLINWSGCGNTLRAESNMARRLITESLLYLVETFDIDGFRFDLAELIGIEVLKEIENALKAVKPGIILIAEPWSFRGHIAADLKATGWAFWNDGFREFLPRYLRGRANPDGIKYYMSGCLSHLTRYPAQSVNYVESHDDRTFLDKITERANHDGSDPTERDKQRMHLMIGILMCSLGTPMITAGMDFLRSKHGKNNTYLDGDENALRYRDIEKHARTARYFREWIRFRLGEFGRVFRLWEHPGDGYTRYWVAPGCTAVAAWWNHDHRYGPCEVLFAVNPHLDRHAKFHLDGLDPGGWTQLANRHTFEPDGLGYTDLNHDHLDVEPMGLCLLVKKKA